METTSTSNLAKGSNSIFATPSASAGALTDKLSLVQIDINSAPSETKRGTKRPNSLSNDTLMPATKKNRDYLPLESKPIYFDLKKQFKKKSQWTAHEQFMPRGNCATTGNFPRSIQ